MGKSEQYNITKIDVFQIELFLQEIERILHSSTDLELIYDYTDLIRLELNGETE